MLKPINPEDIGLYVQSNTPSAYLRVFFENPIDVCPDCYERRDEAVPVLQFRWGANQHDYFRHAVTGERLRDAETVSILMCFGCGWRSITRGEGEGR